MFSLGFYWAFIVQGKNETKIRYIINSQANHGLQATMLIGSLTIISIIAFDRFYMVKISSVSRNRGSKKYFVYSVIAWLLAGCISAPVIYKANLIEVGEDAVRCNVIWMDMSRQETRTLLIASQIQTLSSKTLQT